MTTLKNFLVALTLGLVLTSCEQNENELFEEKMQQSVVEDQQIAAKPLTINQIAWCQDNNKWHGTYIGNKSVNVTQSLGSGAAIARPMNCSWNKYKRLCKWANDVWKMKCNQ